LETAKSGRRATLPDLLIVVKLLDKTRKFIQDTVEKDKLKTLAGQEGTALSPALYVFNY